MIRIILALALLSAGCASTAPEQWQATGLTDARTADNAQCTYVAAANAGVLPVGQGLGPILATGIHRQRLYRLCMEARGYTRP